MKDIWNLIHHIPKSITLEEKGNYIIKNLNSTTTCVTGNGPVKASNIYRTITTLLRNDTTEKIKIQTTNSDETLKTIESLRNNCSF